MSNLFETLADKFLGGVIKHGLLELTHADGSTIRWGKPTPGFPDVAIRFHDAKVARDIVLDPGLGAGEAFMDGRLTVLCGEIIDLLELIRANRPWDRGGTLAAPSKLRAWADKLSFHRDSFSQVRRARANVAHHYDIGNDLYRLFLDVEHMQYSCAYWPRDDMTLVQAQEAKLAHIAAKLAIRPGNAVLDIGCGWGGMAIYLAQQFDVTVTGITLSQEQLALAEERAREAGVADRVRFELIDYRDLAARGDSFDRIVSVGMFEHVGRPQFETFFRACAELLADKGVMLIHTIGKMGAPGTTDAFTRKYIFPGGYIPALSETLAASEKVRLLAADVEMLRLHYARTLRAWYANFIGHQAEIEAKYDARFYRMFCFYLAGAATGFETGGLCNYQIQFVRDRHAIPLTRDWMTQDEAQLTAA